MINKIKVYNLSAFYMGDTNENDAQGYRDWLKSELATEFPGVDIEVSENMNTYSVVVDCDGDFDEQMQARDDVNEFCADAWDRCSWGWSE